MRFLPGDIIEATSSTPYRNAPYAYSPGDRFTVEDVREEPGGIPTMSLKERPWGTWSGMGGFKLVHRPGRPAEPCGCTHIHQPPFNTKTRRYEWGEWTCQLCGDKAYFPGPLG